MQYNNLVCIPVSRLHLHFTCAKRAENDFSLKKSYFERNILAGKEENVGYNLFYH